MIIFNSIFLNFFLVIPNLVKIPFFPKIYVKCELLKTDCLLIWYTSAQTHTHLPLAILFCFVADRDQATHRDQCPLHRKSPHPVFVIVGGGRGEGITRYNIWYANLSAVLRRGTIITLQSSAIALLCSDHTNTRRHTYHLKECLQLVVHPKFHLETFFNEVHLVRTVFCCQELFTICGLRAICFKIDVHWFRVGRFG